MEVARQNKTREEVLRDFRTEEILEAARRVIGETGVAEASVERIAQEAGVAKGTLYLYFKNREVLLANACEQVFAELVRKTRRAVQRARGPRQKLEQVVRVALETGAEHRAFLRALDQDAIDDLDGPAEAVRERLNAYMRLIAGVIERGTKGRAFRPVDSRWAARALVEIMRVGMLDDLQPSHPMSLEAKADTIVDLFVHGIGTGERK